VYLECPEVMSRIATTPQDQLVAELLRISDTIDDIDSAIVAPDFYEGDEEEIRRSREFFERRRTLLRRTLAGESILRT